ncbi:mannitol dehydrogenase family protein [Lactococcus allomyrinae]|uniref:Mannitol dehydrogenase family protein n=1 Tax=Lactococcus allomyrinae TaxID=2419773 RepID=A0A387BH31_9LACT|nr:mannitol dehydrogenase family protein [Lactococcus allomyrinae]AYG00689.1 mannitol dehydrogenase family protein [Lactococcus allomyrinae]
MVKLVDSYLEKAEEFKSANIQVPLFDQEKIAERAAENPTWIHFGGGNLFRCFHAVVAQDLLNKGEMNAGVIVAETYDDEVIEKMYHAYDNRFLSVTMKADGNFDKELIAAVADSFYFNAENIEGWAALTRIFENPSLQFTTFSITEKGYSLRDSQGNLTALALSDIQGAGKPVTNMGAITYLLYARYKAGKFPIAMVSTDNFSENGQKLQEGVLTIARGWVENEIVEQSFYDYLINPQKVSFPWSMIDRITPNPSETVGQLLAASGFEDTEILHTAKHTNIAPFGNTEEVHYLVIEDSFPNGRPALEKAGVIMTDRDTVNDADQMKVTACLNPLHTALAVFGCLLDYHSIADEVANPDLLALIKNLGYGEALPVVKNPKIINPRDFIDQLLTKRLPNKNIPDTPQRIAADTSQKIPVRYGVTIGHYVTNPKFSVSSLEFIPLVIAAWCRYLTGINDDLAKFTPSPDPLLDELQSYLASAKFDGSTENVSELLRPILSNKSIFPQEMYVTGLAGKIETYFAQMLTGKGAVFATLKKALANHGKDY